MLDAFAAAAQIALYASLVCACGGAFAEVTLRPQDEVSTRLLSLARHGSLLMIVAVLAGALILIARLGEFDAPTFSAVMMSGTGAAAGLRIGAGLLLLFATTQDDSFGRGMRLAYATLLVASFVFTGHAAAASFGAGLIACIHVAMAAWWVGSLVAMDRACAMCDVAVVSAIVQRFGRMAVWVIAMLILAGIVLLLALVAWPLVPATPYLQLLALKIALAVCVLGLAAYNKFRLTPRLLAADASSVQTLQTSIRFELLLIAAVLLVTGILTTYHSPHD